MAAGVIEKGNSGLFENEVEFNGKYATMVRHLKEDLGLFSTFREAYVISSIIGLLNSRTETSDSTAKVQAASIFPNELNKRKADLRLIYRIMMLIGDEPTFTIDDYMNRAFRDDSDEERRVQLRQNVAVFNSYVCGGLEYLSEKFSELDKTDAIIDTLYEMVHGFAIDVDLLEGEELPDFEPNF